MVAQRTKERAVGTVYRYLSRHSRREEGQLRRIAAEIVEELISAGIELKYNRRRTLRQNAFIHLLFDYFAKQLADTAENLWAGITAAHVKEGIKAKYGPRILNPFIEGELIVKPTHLYDTTEIDAIVEGVFVEAGELGVDMSEFVREWERIKERREKDAREKSA